MLRRFKGVDDEWTQFVREAKGVFMSLGQQMGMANFSVVPIEDYEMFFSMRFIDYLRPIEVSYEDTILLCKGINYAC